MSHHYIESLSVADNDAFMFPGDLNRMHRINKEVYVNPESRDRRWPPGSVGRIGGGGGLTPRGISGSPTLTGTL